MLIQRYPIILFDLDETLFEFKLQQERALKQVLHPLGVAVTPKVIRRFREINHHLWQQVVNQQLCRQQMGRLRFERLLGTPKPPLDFETLNQKFMQEMHTPPILLPHAEQTLRLLARYSQIGVITNGETTLQTQRIALSPLAGYISTLVTSEDLGCLKPNPKILAHGIHQLTTVPLPKSKVLLVGDQPVADIKGALDFGIHACFFNRYRRCLPPSIQPTYTVTNLLQLQRLLCHSID